MFLEYFLHIMKLEDDSECNSEENCVYDMISGLLLFLFFVMFYMSFMFSPICKTGEMTYYVKNVYIKLWGENIYSYIPYIILFATMVAAVSLLLWKYIFTGQKKKCMKISYIIVAMIIEMNVLLVITYMRTLLVNGINITLTNGLYFLVFGMFFILFPVLEEVNHFNNCMVIKLKKGWWTKWTITVLEIIISMVILINILQVVVDYINTYV